MDPVAPDIWTYRNRYGDPITITHYPDRGCLKWETSMDDGGRMSVSAVDQQDEAFLRWGPPRESSAWVELSMPVDVARAIVARLGAPEPAWLRPLPAATRRLLVAAREGRDDEVKAALGEGAAVDATDAFGNTALVLALHAGKESAALALLASGAGATREYAFRGEPKTALSLAVEQRLAGAAAALLARGASPEEPDSQGTTLLMRVPGGPGSDAIVAALLAAGADPLARDRHGNTTVQSLVANGAGAPTLAWVLALGASAKAASGSGQTPLMVACGAGRDRAYAPSHPSLEMARLLLASGAEVDAVDANGETALTRAARLPDVAMVKLLLDHGASARHASPDGVTALGVAAQRSAPMEIGRLLLQAGADPNGRSEKGATALMGACWSKSPAWFDELLAAGADPEARTPSGEGVLDVAAKAKAAWVEERLRAFRAARREPRAVVDCARRAAEAIRSWIVAHRDGASSRAYCDRALSWLEAPGGQPQGDAGPLRLTVWITRGKSREDEEFWEETRFWELGVGPDLLSFRSYDNMATIMGAEQRRAFLWSSASPHDAADQQRIEEWTTGLIDALQTTGSVSLRLEPPFASPSATRASARGESERTFQDHER